MDILVYYMVKWFLMEEWFKNHRVLILTAILLLAAFFRFWQIGAIPPGLYPDEAMNGNNALEALETGDYKVFYSDNFGREGLFINIQAIFLKFICCLSSR